MSVMPEQKPIHKVVIHDNDKQKTVALPNYGEVKIVCHDGKVKTVERTEKEQM